MLRISSGEFAFAARLEEETAPRTVAAFRRLLPIESRVGVSETELLFPYGHVAFASKAGLLAGNHFATVVEGVDQLRKLGERCLWQGAQEIALTES